MMTPAQHLKWFADTTTWFEAISPSEYEREVPSCPGWKIEDVVSHLGIGLGLAYPFALTTAPGAPLGAAFADVPFPRPMPTGVAARAAFVKHMSNCLTTYKQTDPAHECWTYEGPGAASFWFRRAAIEIALHRGDVEMALGIVPSLLTDQQSLDAIAEAAGLVLPLAADLLGATPQAITLFHDQSGSAFTVGAGPSVAEVHGTGDDVLAASWGRNTDRVVITGDAAAARVWFDLVPVAFARSE